MPDKATSKKLDRIVKKLNSLVSDMQKFQDETGDYTYARAIVHINKAISDIEFASEDLFCGNSIRYRKGK